MDNERFLDFCKDNAKAGIWRVDPYLYLGAAISEEAGEVTGECKKYVRDDDCILTPERRQKMLLELGDLLYYSMLLVDMLDCTFEEVFDLVAEKIRAKIAKNRGISNP